MSSRGSSADSTLRRSGSGRQAARQSEVERSLSQLEADEEGNVRFGQRANRPNGRSSHTGGGFDNEPRIPYRPKSRTRWLRYAVAPASLAVLVVAEIYRRRAVKNTAQPEEKRSQSVKRLMTLEAVAGVCLLIGIALMVPDQESDAAAAARRAAFAQLARPPRRPVRPRVSTSDRSGPTGEAALRGAALRRRVTEDDAAAVEEARFRASRKRDLSSSSSDASEGEL
jgi:heme exporter protein D